jgi:hypothetical protein
MTANGEYAQATGDCITGGTETWYYEFDQPFLLADGSGHCIEVVISLLKGGRYAVKYHPGVWPSGGTGGW